GLVHMNGRVYDPELGRFLSADPFVQDATDLQSLNRYTYVLNNPLSLTDSSGFFFESLLEGIFGGLFVALFEQIQYVLKTVLGPILEIPVLGQIVQLAATAAACYFGGPPGCAAAAATFSAAKGGSLSDALIAAAVAYAVAGGFGDLGGTVDVTLPSGAGQCLAVCGGTTVTFGVGQIAGTAAKAGMSVAEQFSDSGAAGEGFIANVGATEFGPTNHLGDIFDGVAAATAGNRSIGTTVGAKFGNGANTDAYANMYSDNGNSLIIDPAGADLTVHGFSQARLNAAAVDAVVFIVTDVIFSVVGPVGRAAGFLSRAAKTDQLVSNIVNGRIAEREVAKQLISKGNSILGTQVSVRTRAGLRRVDILTVDAGKLVGVEVKSGSATRSAAQLAKDRLIATEGGVIVGKNAPASLRGRRVVFDTIQRNF
ncbi:MAG: hypothetical protein GY788_02380, partial [bacterium]|nr:hypothetical protein [bacterium]